MDSRNQFIFPNSIIIDISDPIRDFMDQFNPERLYSQYDYVYMLRVLRALSPAFVYSFYFERELNKVMTSFIDSQLYYSDETYAPNKTITSAYRLGRKIFDVLRLNKAYSNNVFPYFVEQLEYDLAVIFKLSRTHATFALNR